MLYFERGQEPKDTLGVGAKKDAIKITGVGYFLKGEELHITNPIKAQVFVERLKKGALPNDSITGIESVFVWYDARDMEEDWDAKFNRTFSAGQHNGRTQYKETKNTITYELDEIHGKVLNICEKLILFPTLEELKEAGFGYLEEYRKGEEMVREEDKRIQKSLRKKLTELQEKGLEEERKGMEEELKSKEKEEMARTAREYLNNKEKWQNAGDDHKMGFGDWIKENWTTLNRRDKMT